MEPSMADRVILRRVVAVQNEWVQRYDNGGIIKVPYNHIWIECENPEECKDDSISSYGPISQRFVIGEAVGIVWPFWRICYLTDIEKFGNFLGIYKNVKHSRVYSSEEIYNRFGIIWCLWLIKFKINQYLLSKVMSMSYLWDNTWNKPSFFLMNSPSKIFYISEKASFLKSL